jgi:putative ABC transport system permease protein
MLTDFRSLLRGLRRDITSIALAIVSLAMGIGFTTTLYSIVRGATRDLPFEDAGSLMAVARIYPGIEDPLPATPREFAAWSAGQRSFDAIAGVRATAMNLAGPEARPERANGAFVSPNAFSILRVTPAFGRPLESSDAVTSAAPVVLLGDAVWRNRFGGDSTIVGRAIRVDGVMRTVIGVMPRGFQFPVNGDLWIPHAFAPGGADSLESVLVFGRLRDGVSRDAASAEMRTIADQLQLQIPRFARNDRRRSYVARVVPLTNMEFPAEVAVALNLMLLASLAVLVIACVNVANLLIARFTTKEADVAVRVALGASRARVVLWHLGEALMLAFGGAVLGLGIAWVGVGFFDRMTASVIEAFWMDFRVDMAALLFATTATVIAALAAGLFPALRASRSDPADTLRAGASSSALRIGRIARGLVIGEIALACALLVVSTLLVRGAVAMRATVFPFEPRSILTAELSLVGDARRNTPARTQLLRDIQDRVARIPGVRGTAMMSVLPGRGVGYHRIAVDGAVFERPQDAPFSGVLQVTPGFLETLDAKVVGGRDLAWSDNDRSPRVALVNTAWVAKHMAGADPIGHRVSVQDGDPYTIVGIVPDLHPNDVDGDNRRDAIYTPMQQASYVLARILVRTDTRPEALTEQLRDAVLAVDPDLPLFEVATLHDAIFADKKILDAFGGLFFAFGIGALLLTATGLYGIVTFSVARRTREFGVRMALGATAREVKLLVLRQGGRQVVLGLGIGLALGALLAVALRSAVQAIDVGNAGAYAIPVVLLLLTASVALLVPARRASKLEPVRALRH